MMVGPFDLRASMGLSGSHGIEERYLYAVENVARACNSWASPLVCTQRTWELAKNALSLGSNYYVTAIDAPLLVHGAKANLSMFLRRARFAHECKDIVYSIFHRNGTL